MIGASRENSGGVNESQTQICPKNPTILNQAASAANSGRLVALANPPTTSPPTTDNTSSRINPPPSSPRNP
jgi:hypothetical protein